MHGLRSLMCKRSPWLHAFSRTASFGRGGLARCRVNAHPAWRDRARRRLPALGRGGADGMPPARALWQVKPAGYLGPALQRAWHCILQLPRARASRPYATQPSGAVCSRFPEHTNASAADCDAHASKRVHSFIQHTDRPPLARGRPTLAWAARAALPPGRMFGVGGVRPAIGGP